MPLTNPAYPPGPYRFVDREFFTVTYRTDSEKLAAVIPVRFERREGNDTHCMFLNDHPPITGGRELWGFPKKLASPILSAQSDTLVGILDYGPVRVATGTIGYKHKEADLGAVRNSLDAPNYLLKFNPHALAPVADLPVLELLSAVLLKADLTLGFGKVAYDYLA